MAEPAPGDRIAPDLVLVRPLVQGGMGTVWVAHHERLEVDVAIKLLSKHLVDDDVAKKRFAREAASAQEVKSPHVVQMLDHGISEKGVPYCVMELLSGEDLEARLASGPLPPRDVLSIVTQVGRALETVHALSIIHRDIKPANIFLIEKGAARGDTYLVKLVDFGFAKRIGKSSAQLTEEGMVVGTPNYMSPEQMTGTKLDLRSDLFSLAAVAFEAFTGTRAFPGKTLHAIDQAIHKRSLPCPSQLNPALPSGVDAWFAKGCARDRDDRFKTAPEMVAALQKVFASVEGPRSVEERAPDARLVSPSSSSSKTVVIVLVFLLVAAAIFWTQMRH